RFFALHHLGQTNHFARRLGSGAGEDRDSPTDVLDGRGHNLLLLALIQSIELAVRSEHEQAMNAALYQAIQEPAKPRKVEVLVRLHGGRHRGNDTANLHGIPHVVPIIASASISTSISGAINRRTSTMLVAGRISLNTSPW